MKLRLNPDRLKGIIWSAPDARTPAICSLCFGPLPEVPLMLWRDDSSAASLCDDCAELAIEAVP